MSLFADFVVEASAGLVGVFVGVLLALWVERRRHRFVERRDQEQEAARLEDARSLVLMSVVKNTSEAKRLVGRLDDASDPYHFNAAFETAVWEATQASFVHLSNLDERVQFARFFDQVRHLKGLLVFQRDLLARHELSHVAADSGDRALFTGINDRLRGVAHDVRLEGVVLVSDHGSTNHKRLLGLATAPPGESPPPQGS